MEVVVLLQFTQLFVALTVSWAISCLCSSGGKLAMSRRMTLREAGEAYSSRHAKFLSLLEGLLQEVPARGETVFFFAQHTQTRIRRDLA